MKLTSVTPENVRDESLFCVKDLKSPGFEAKEDWFAKCYQEGLRIRILRDDRGKAISFIEYCPADKAWRPVDAPNYMFIHCMYTYSNRDKGQGYGEKLVRWVEMEAHKKKMFGITVMTSKGAWMADKRLFEKCGFHVTDSRGRFDLLTKKFSVDYNDPVLINWEAEHAHYQGWHLVYADQCPWHEKAVKAMLNVASQRGVDIVVRKIESSREAKTAPSGFGVFSLLHDGRLLEDHYLSATRFSNILDKELANSN